MRAGVVLSGFDSDFRAEIQDKKPILIKSAFDPSYISQEEMNEIFLCSDPAHENFKIAYESRVLAKSEYTELYQDIGDPQVRLKQQVVYELLGKGATLIANKVVNSAKIFRIENEMSAITGRRSLTSAYLAYRSMDSFRSHWDTRDVFALQFAGRKRWVINAPSFSNPYTCSKVKT